MAKSEALWNGDESCRSNVVTAKEADCNRQIYNVMYRYVLVLSF